MTPFYRRRKHFYRGNNYYNEAIIFDEFEFYIRQQDLITEEEIKTLKKRFETETLIYWSNEEYAKNHMAFKFYKENCEEDNTKTPVYEWYAKLLIFNFSFTMEQFKPVVQIYNQLFLYFKLIDSQEALLDESNINNNEMTGLDDNLKLKKIFTNWEEVVNYLIERREQLGNGMNWDELNERSFTFFGLELTQPKYKVMENHVSFWSNSYHIFKVIERRINNVNYRIAFTSHIKNYDNVYFQINIYSEIDNSYNFIDENRIMLINDSTRTTKKVFLDLTLTATADDGSIFIDLDTYKLIDENIYRTLAPNENMVTPAIYRFYFNQVKRVTYKDKQMTEQEAKLIKHYLSLLQQGREIKLSQVILTKNSIRTDDNMFSIKFEDNFFNMEQSLHQIKTEIDKGDARYNFNALYDIILKHSTVKVIDMGNVQNYDYKIFSKSSFTVNEIPIVVAKENNRLKINEIFCRIDDAFDILSKAICFNSIDDYEKYIKDVSYIGLHWKKLINNGVQLYLENPLLEGFKRLGKTATDKVIIRFSLLWDTMHRNNVYLVANNKQYLIKYKAKFLRHFDIPERSVRMTFLKKALRETLENFDSNIILEITANAIQEARIVQERGKELVAETIKNVKAKEETIALNDRNINGFVIIGVRTGRTYFVDKMDLNVFRFDDGKWNRRCVVSDSSKQRIFEDRLANRLINIYNENTKITTLFS